LASPPLATTSDEITDDRFMAWRFPLGRWRESLRKIGPLRAGAAEGEVRNGGIY
jgi:hypothetical protein